MTAEPSRFPINKLIAIAFVVVGFLIVASGYRYGSLSTVLGGCLVLAIGIILLIAKIIRRNP